MWTDGSGRPSNQPAASKIGLRSPHRGLVGHGRIISVAHLLTREPVRREEPAGHCPGAGPRRRVGEEVQGAPLRPRFLARTPPRNAAQYQVAFGAVCGPSWATTYSWSIGWSLFAHSCPTNDRPESRAGRRCSGPNRSGRWPSCRCGTSGRPRVGSRSGAPGPTTRRGSAARYGPGS
jgi:hypothetical protein